MIYHYSLERSISNRKGVWLVLVLRFLEIPVFNANNVDSDQIPHYVVSDLSTLFANVAVLGTLGINGLKMSRHWWGKYERPVVTFQLH